MPKTNARSSGCARMAAVRTKQGRLALRLDGINLRRDDAKIGPSPIDGDALPDTAQQCQPAQVSVGEEFTIGQECAASSWAPRLLAATGSVPPKPCGAMPMTRKRRRFRLMVRPTIAGSAPKVVRHRSSLRTTTAPGVWRRAVARRKRAARGGRHLEDVEVVA